MTITSRMVEQVARVYEGPEWFTQLSHEEMRDVAREALEAAGVGEMVEALRFYAEPHRYEADPNDAHEYIWALADAGAEARAALKNAGVDL